MSTTFLDATVMVNESASLCIFLLDSLLDTSLTAPLDTYSKTQILYTISMVLFLKCIYNSAVDNQKDLTHCMSSVACYQYQYCTSDGWVLFNASVILVAICEFSELSETAALLISFHVFSKNMKH
jgi:hypothetical protein